MQKTNARLITGTDPIQLMDFCLAGMAEVAGDMVSRLDERAFLIVPEALKADLERRYLGNYDVDGLMLAEVLSFNRLAHRIFSIAGGLATGTISKMGKSLIIQRLIHDHPTNFKRFQRFAGLPGYSAELEKVLSDFKKFDLDQDTLTTLAELAPPSLTKDKLEDFATLQNLYQEKMQEFELLDQDDNLDRLADLFQDEKWQSELEFLRKTRIWITGFSDIRTFNQQELKLIQLLSPRVKELNITLCTDLQSEDSIRRELFEPGYQAFIQLQKILPKSEITVLPELISPVRKSLQNTILTGILKDFDNNILDNTGNSTDATDSTDAIGDFVTGFEGERTAGSKVHSPDDSEQEYEQFTLIAAEDKRQEWGFIAGEIKRLLAENNYQKKDIGISICDSIHDLSIEKSVFREFGLDTFLSDRIPIRQTALYRYLFGFFELSTNDFSLNDLLAFLRSGLVEPSEDEIDKFENICLEFGLDTADKIQSNKFYERIDTNLNSDNQEQKADGQEQIELTSYNQDQNTDNQEQNSNLISRKPWALSFKKNHLDPVFFTLKEMRKKRRGADKSRYLLEWLSQESLMGRLQQMIDQLRESKEEDVSLSLARSWELLIQLLEESITLLGESGISQKGFAEIILGTLSGQTPTSIPVGLDRIRVGGLREMMYYDCKVLFIAGATQATFPATNAQEGFLHQTEINWIELNSEKTLPDYKTNSILSGQVTAVLNLTTPKERVYLSTPSVDQEEWAGIFRLLDKELKNITDKAEKSELVKRINLSSVSLGDQSDPDQRWLTVDRTKRYLQLNRKLEDEINRNSVQKTKIVFDTKQDYFLPEAKTFWQKAITQLETQVASKVSSQNSPSQVQKQAQISLADLVEKREIVSDPLDQIKPHLYLDPCLAKLSFDKRSYYSASGLEGFQSCPYQYFANYGLQLRERPLWAVDRRDLGTLVHQMMELALREIDDRLKNISDPQVKQIEFKKWLESILSNKYYDELYNRSVKASGIITYADGVIAASQGTRIKRHARAALWFTGAIIDPDAFFPVAYEWKFPPDKNKNYQEINISPDAKQQISLRGVIDRVDLNSAKQYRIFDYKTGSKTIDLQQIYLGLDLQLGFYQKIWQVNHPEQTANKIAYLKFINKPKDVVKKLFYPPEKELKQRLIEINPINEIKTTDSAELNAIGEHAVKQAKQAVSKIRKGLISPIPKAIKSADLPCKYCKHQEMCRYDLRLIEKRADFVQAPEAKEILELLVDQSEQEK